MRTLELFGSAVGDRFRPETSDFDFLVEFAPTPPAESARCYVGLLFALQDLFGRDVDLVRPRRSAIATSFSASPRTGSCSMRPEALKYLYDMQQACRLLAAFLDGKTFDDSADDVLLRSGVEKRSS